MATVARNGGQRLTLRPAASPLDHLIPRADGVRDLQKIATLGVRYIDEIDAPDLREPFSIRNRRDDLRDAVYGIRRPRAGKRAA